MTNVRVTTHIITFYHWEHRLGRERYENMSRGSIVIALGSSFFKPWGSSDKPIAYIAVIWNGSVGYMMDDSRSRAIL
jgi:hypothetical protein